VRTWQYDATGNLIAETDSEGHTTRQEIVSWNLVGKRRDAAGTGVSYEYSSLEKVTAITDTAGNRSEYDWDKKQRLVRVRRHGRVREEYVYDAGDHFIEKRGADGQTLFENSLHPSHFVHERKLASGGLHRYDYDRAGRVTEASTELHTVHLGYDAAGERLLDLRDGRGIAHSPFTESGRASHVLGRYRLLEERLALGTRLTDAAGSSTSLDFLRPGLVQRKCANGTLEVLQFDEDGRLEGALRHRPRHAGQKRVWTVRYEYSPEGDLVRVADSERGTTQYQVDVGHRLVSEKTPRGDVLHFALDSAGNLLARPGLGDFGIKAGNQLSYSAAESFEYDTRNHVCRRTHRATGRRVFYEYDSYDMLVRIRYERPELSTLQELGALPAFEADAPQQHHPDRTPHCLDWSAHYDALGRRLWTQWTTPEGQTLRREFYWDGDRLAAEILPTGTLRIFQYGTADALSPIQFTEYSRVDAAPDSGKTYHIFYDASGQALSIEDSLGIEVWRIERADPYGLHDLRPRQDIDYANPGAAIEYNLRWPGHYLDPETGLHYNRYRYYDPRLGRYVQSDPIGYEGSPLNLYAYCANPLVQVDVLGLDQTTKSDTTKSTDVDGKEGVAKAKADGDGPEGQSVGDLLNRKLGPDKVSDMLAAKRANKELDQLLTDDEYLAIRGYTSNLYGDINPALRRGDAGEWSPLVKNAESGMDKMAKNGHAHEGAAKRGATFTDAQIAELFPEGGTFKDPAFLSSSSKTDQAFPGNTTIEIASRKGVKVQSLSEFAHESEVLFPPGTEFQVVSKEFNSQSNTWNIVLQEV
jgi:RHS repeat-associated protein